MTRDEAFAQGARCAWRNIWLIVAILALGFISASAIGYGWEQIERFLQ